MASMRVASRASIGTALSSSVIRCDSLDRSRRAEPSFVIVFLSGAFLKEPHVESPSLKFRFTTTLKSVFCRHFSGHFYLLLCSVWAQRLKVFSAPRSTWLHMGKMSALIRESELECDVPIITQQQRKMSLLFRTQILVIMHHLQLLYLRCGLSAKVWRDEWRCRWRIQCCVWSPRRELTSLAVKPEQVWRQAGTIRRRRPRVFLCFRCNSSHVGSLHTLADQSLSTVD